MYCGLYDGGCIAGCMMVGVLWAEWWWVCYGLYGGGCIVGCMMVGVLWAV